MVTRMGLQQLTSRLPHSEQPFLLQLTGNVDFFNSKSPKISRSALDFGHRGCVCLFVCFLQHFLENNHLQSSNPSSSAIVIYSEYLSLPSSPRQKTFGTVTPRKWVCVVWKFQHTSLMAKTLLFTSSNAPVVNTCGVTTERRKHRPAHSVQ